MASRLLWSSLAWPAAISPEALVVYERLGTLLEPDKVRKELEELPG